MPGGIAGTVKCRQTSPICLQLWQAMRILRRFTVGQLVVTSQHVSYSHATGYTAHLRRCGHLRVDQARRRGRPGEADMLKLVRDTGPLAPIPRRTTGVVYDANTGIVWGPDGREVVDPPRPAPPRMVSASTPPTNVQRVAMMLLLEGRPINAALGGNANAGTLASVLHGLQRRGLVDAAGALTDAGRALATADQAVYDAACPAGWTP